MASTIKFLLHVRLRLDPPLEAAVFVGCGYGGPQVARRPVGVGRGDGGFVPGAGVGSGCGEGSGWMGVRWVVRSMRRLLAVSLTCWMRLSSRSARAALRRWWSRSGSRTSALARLKPIRVLMTTA